MKSSEVVENDEREFVEVFKFSGKIQDQELLQGTKYLTQVHTSLGTCGPVRGQGYIYMYILRYICM